jgi:hypothetical protein
MSEATDAKITRYLSRIADALESIAMTLKQNQTPEQRADELPPGYRLPKVPQAPR